MYIEESRFEASAAPVFKLADLARLYISRMEQFGVVDKRVNTTRLKQRLHKFLICELTLKGKIYSWGLIKILVLQ